MLVVAGVLFGMGCATSDVEVYHLPAFLGLAIAGGVCVGLLLQHRRRELRVVGWLSTLLLPLFPAAAHLRSHDLRNTTVAVDYVLDIPNGVPENRILFVEVDDASGVLYWHQVLGKRPDVTIYNRCGILHGDLAVDLTLARKPGENMEA